MTVLLALFLAAPPAATPSPTPVPTTPITILLAKPGSETTSPRGGSLADVAKKIKLRLPSDQPRVINNEAVRQLSEGVELTTSAAPEPGRVATGERRTGADAKKAMWQREYIAARQRVAQLEAEVRRLEGEANRLQAEFYAHDDPAERDGVIKPAWDRALADLKLAQASLEEARRQPDAVLNEARRDGALPGWFRGLEQQIANTPAQESPAAPTPRTRTSTPPMS